MHGVDISPLPAMPVVLELVPVEFDVGGQPLRAAATAWATAPVVTAQRFALVQAFAATAQASGNVPLVGVTFVIVVRAASTGASLVPVVTGSANVTAAIATSTSLAGSAINPVNFSVAAVKASGTGISPAPAISGEVVLTGGGPGTASALAIVPTVTAV